MLHIRLVENYRKRRLAFDVEGALEYATRRIISPVTLFADLAGAIEIRPGRATLYSSSGGIIEDLHNDNLTELRKRLTLLFPSLEE
jgi:hypothetical protein